ncbi:MAG: hypothetical protein P4L91_01510 [Burkholderiaceae bacterium]|nr:hypothetical protein [Burkholderiaceae bacterium]
MTANQDTWKNIGSSKTNSVDNTTRKEVHVESDYGLTVGFEVNDNDAFVNDVQNLDKDYGHAFFYLTKNYEVLEFFSFGPSGLGQQGKFVSPYQNERPGTPDYPVSEAIKLFRLKLTQAQAQSLLKDTEKIRGEIISGKRKYTAYLNDTCAETARDIIKKTIPNIPDGSGQVKFAGHNSIISVVNPYMWHKNFKAKYKEISRYSLGYDAKQILPKGSGDPVASEPFETIK